MSSACLLLFAALLVSCGGGDADTSSGEGQESNTASSGASASSETTAASETPQTGDIFLNAFDDFRCTSGWTNRNGALGRAAFSGSGSCTAAFPGESGTYAVTLVAQSEFDGASPYEVRINGQTVKQGNIPFSKGSLICDCPDWQTNCPDRVVNIDAGRRQVNNGDQVFYFGDDVYPCGDDTHGAYAKWRGIDFRRLD